MIDVFISYSRENKEVAKRLAEGVAREGYSVWWDEEIPPHLSYGDLITEKIGNAKAAIVIWSKSASGSEWVRAEANLAREAKKLIQTSVDGTTPPLPFNLIQFAAIGDWQGEEDHPGWKRVKTSLTALCGPPAATVPPVPVEAPAPPPPPPPPPPAPLPPPPPAPVPQPLMATAPETTVPPAASSNSSRLAFSLIGAAGAAALALAGYVWWRGDPPAPVEGPAVVNGVTVAQLPAPAPSPNPAPVPTPPPSAPAPSMRIFTQQAMIDDSDGFTNVRSGPSEAFGIVGRVNRAEVFSTYPQTGQWWQVRLANGRVGYMSASRIRPYDPNQPPPSMDGRWTVTWRAGGANYNGNLEVANGGGAMIVSFGSVRIRQACSVAATGANVNIRCRNPQFLSGKGEYSPDSFTLTLRDAPVLQGRIRDTQNVSATATFRRH